VIYLAGFQLADRRVGEAKTDLEQVVIPIRLSLLEADRLISKLISKRISTITLLVQTMTFALRRQR
jgi:hypothetical protein